MNTQLQIALELLDRANATYVVTHSSLKAPIFSEDRAKKSHTKLAFAQPVGTRRKAVTKKSKWRAVLADMAIGDTKELAPPAGVSQATFQLRLSAAAHAYFGKGNYATKLLSDGRVRVTRK